MLFFLLSNWHFLKTNNSLYSKCHGKTGGNINLHNSFRAQHNNTYQHIKLVFFYPEYLLSISPIEILAKGQAADVCTRTFTALFLKTKKNGNVNSNHSLK